MGYQILNYKMTNFFLSGRYNDGSLIMLIFGGSRMKIVIAFIVGLLVVIGGFMFWNKEEVDFVLLNDPIPFELEQREWVNEE